MITESLVVGSVRVKISLPAERRRPRTPKSRCSWTCLAVKRSSHCDSARLCELPSVSTS